MEKKGAIVADELDKAINDAISARFTAISETDIDHIANLHAFYKELPASVPCRRDDLLWLIVVANKAIMENQLLKKTANGLTTQILKSNLERTNLGRIF